METYKLRHTGQELDEVLDSAVTCKVQSFEDVEKRQIRENIGAANIDITVTCEEQEFTDEQKIQIRENIGAVDSATAVTCKEQEFSIEQKAQIRKNIGITEPINITSDTRMLTPDDFDGDDSDKLQACFNELSYSYVNSDTLPKTAGGVITINRPLTLTRNIKITNDSNDNYQIVVQGCGKHSVINMNGYRFEGLATKNGSGAKVSAPGLVLFSGITFNGKITVAGKHKLTKMLAECGTPLLIRLRFDGCYFNDFYDLIHSERYVQSVNITNSYLRFIMHYVFDATNVVQFELNEDGTYKKDENDNRIIVSGTGNNGDLLDCKFSHNVFEWGGGIANVKSYNGCHFTNNCIEGCIYDEDSMGNRGFAKPLSYIGCDANGNVREEPLLDYDARAIDTFTVKTHIFGVEISNNYCEKNQKPFFDLSKWNRSAYSQLSLTICNNHFMEGGSGTDLIVLPCVHNHENKSTFDTNNSNIVLYGNQLPPQSGTEKCTLIKVPSTTPYVPAQDDQEEMLPRPLQIGSKLKSVVCYANTGSVSDTAKVLNELRATELNELFGVTKKFITNSTVTEPAITLTYGGLLNTDGSEADTYEKPLEDGSTEQAVINTRLRSGFISTNELVCIKQKPEATDSTVNTEMRVHFYDNSGKYIGNSGTYARSFDVYDWLNNSKFKNTAQVRIVVKHIDDKSAENNGTGTREELREDDVSYVVERAGILRYGNQQLTDEQQAQVRKNIGVSMSGRTVTLDNFTGTDTEKLQAAFDSLSNSKTYVNGILHYETVGGTLVIDRPITLEDDIIIRNNSSKHGQIVVRGEGKQAILNMNGYCFKGVRNIWHTYEDATGETVNWLTDPGGILFRDLTFNGEVYADYFSNQTGITKKLVHCGASLLRIRFDGCYFNGFYDIIYADTYIQSVNITNSTIRGIANYIYYATEYATASEGNNGKVLDCRFSHNVFENSTGGVIAARQLSGCYFTDNCIEGCCVSTYYIINDGAEKLSNPDYLDYPEITDVKNPHYKTPWYRWKIEYNNKNLFVINQHATGVEISNNYLELNKKHLVDLSVASTSSGNLETVRYLKMTICNNHFVEGKAEIAMIKLPTANKYFLPNSASIIIYGNEISTANDNKYLLWVDENGPAGGRTDVEDPDGLDGIVCFANKGAVYDPASRLKHISPVELGELFGDAKKLKEAFIDISALKAKNENTAGHYENSYINLTHGAINNSGVNVDTYTDTDGTIQPIVSRLRSDYISLSGLERIRQKLTATDSTLDTELWAYLYDASYKYLGQIDKYSKSFEASEWLPQYKNAAFVRIVVKHIKDTYNPNTYSGNIEELNEEAVCGYILEHCGSVTFENIKMPFAMSRGALGGARYIFDEEKNEWKEEIASNTGLESPYSWSYKKYCVDDIVTEDDTEKKVLETLSKKTTDWLGNRARSNFISLEGLVTIVAGELTNSSEKGNFELAVHLYDDNDKCIRTIHKDGALMWMPEFRPEDHREACKGAKTVRVTARRKGDGKLVDADVYYTVDKDGNVTVDVKPETAGAKCIAVKQYDYYNFWPDTVMTKRYLVRRAQVAIDTLRYDTQELTPKQQEQARSNIGAAPADQDFELFQEIKDFKYKYLDKKFDIGFLAVNDTHTTSTYFSKVMRYFAKNRIGDFVAHLGDAEQDHKPKKEDATKSMKNQIDVARSGGGLEVYQVRGNHDTNPVNGYETTKDGKPINAYNKAVHISDSDYYNIFTRGAEKVNKAAVNLNYYYRDFEESKIRVIFLDSGDIYDHEKYVKDADGAIVEDENGKPKENPYYGYPMLDAYNTCFQQEQADWFKNVALNLKATLKDNTNYADWAVITLAHGPLEALSPIIGAFVTGSKYDESADGYTCTDNSVTNKYFIYKSAIEITGPDGEAIFKDDKGNTKVQRKIQVDRSCDFTDQGPMEHIMHFNGHIGIDDARVIDFTYSDSEYDEEKGKNVYVKHTKHIGKNIVLGNSYKYAPPGPYGFTSMVTNLRLHFITVDRENKKVEIYRIGQLPSDTNLTARGTVTQTYGRPEYIAASEEKTEGICTVYYNRDGAGNMISYSKDSMLAMKDEYKNI